MHVVYIPHLDYCMQKTSCELDDVRQKLNVRLAGGKPTDEGAYRVHGADGVESSAESDGAFLQ